MTNQVAAGGLRKSVTCRGERPDATQDVLYYKIDEQTGSIKKGISRSGKTKKSQEMWNTETWKTARI